MLFLNIFGSFEVFQKTTATSSVDFKNISVSKPFKVQTIPKIKKKKQ